MNKENEKKYHKEWAGAEKEAKEAIEWIDNTDPEEIKRYMEVII